MRLVAGNVLVLPDPVPDGGIDGGDAVRGTIALVDVCLGFRPGERVLYTSINDLRTEFQGEPHVIIPVSDILAVL